MEEIKMAGFCTSCGKPLPENGICPCKAQAAPQQPYAAPQQPYAAPQQPYAAPQQPYAAPQQPYTTQQTYMANTQQPIAPYTPVVLVRQGPSAFGKFFKTVLDYFKDPVGASRTVLDSRDIVSGGLAAAACVLLTLLGTLLFALVADRFDFGDVAPAWIVMSIFGPALAIGITFGLAMALAKIAKLPVDPMGLLSVTCINTILPACLLAASMLLGMIGGLVFEIFAILLFAAWAVTAFTMIFQVLNIKMNIISIAVLIAGMAVAFIIIMLLLNWFLFDGNISLFISFFYD